MSSSSGAILRATTAATTTIARHVPRSGGFRRFASSTTAIGRSGRLQSSQWPGQEEQGQTARAVGGFHNGGSSFLGHLSHARTTIIQQQQQRRSMAHTVRIIVTDKELPNGQGYKGDVLHVKSGYARNYLIPQKMAVYATRRNFERLDMKDPDQETEAERQERLARAQEGSLEDDKDLRAADLLKYYLRNKVLKIWRNIDPATGKIHPGMVDAKAVRKKLGRQLRIDLEPHEKVHLGAEPVEMPHDEKGSDEQELLNVMQSLVQTDPEEPCTVEIRQLGDYIARISLRGGFAIPLRVTVLGVKR